LERVGDTYELQHKRIDRQAVVVPSHDVTQDDRWIANAGGGHVAIKDRGNTSDQRPRRPSRMDMSTGCPSCEGRGWRYVSPRGLIRVAEDVVPLTRRLCSDYLGRPVSKRPA